MSKLITLVSTSGSCTPFTHLSFHNSPYFLNYIYQNRYTLTETLQTKSIGIRKLEKIPFKITKHHCPGPFWKILVYVFISIK